MADLIRHLDSGFLRLCTEQAPAGMMFIACHPDALFTIVIAKKIAGIRETAEMRFFLCLCFLKLF